MERETECLKENSWAKFINEMNSSVCILNSLPKEEPQIIDHGYILSKRLCNDLPFHHPWSIYTTAHWLSS
jgi:hypothetical protein